MGNLNDSNDLVIAGARVEVTSGGWKTVIKWDEHGTAMFWWLPCSVPGSVQWSHDFIIISYIVHLHALHFLRGGVL